MEEVYWKSVFPNNSMPKALKDILPSSDPSEGFNRPTNSRGTPANNDKYVTDDTFKGESEIAKVSKSNHAKGVDEGNGDWRSKLSGGEGEENGEDAYFDDWRSKLSSNQGFVEDNYVDDWRSKLSSNHGNEELDDWDHDFSGSHGNGEDSYFDDWRSKLSGNHGNGEDAYFDDWRSKLSSNHGNEEFDDWSHDFSGSQGNSEDEYFDTWRSKPSSNNGNGEFDDRDHDFSARHGNEEEALKESKESFIDLSIATLGKDIQLLSNQLSKETNNPLFTIARGMQDMGENELICHKERYPRAVFLCHSINKTTVYKVPLLGRDGTKANALAVCHKDTSAWSPKHKAFQILKVKPGTVPICHFLAKDTLAWVSN
ncbi:hypothetical protein GOBAR_DD21285 [Gossypium barbadense]|nr:hypothetical protein GOBAR_DD21285 [Gossypium barbadense]